MITPYPHQETIITEVGNRMRQGFKNVLLQSATGSGKSIMASAFAARAMAKGNRVWFTVPRKDLLRQMAETFSEFSIGHSYIAAGNPFNPMADAHICSIGSMKSRLAKAIPPQLAIIDEVHHGGATLDYIIKWLKSHGTYIIMLSATPIRTDGRGLGCWADTMVEGPSIRWLIDNGWLSDYRPFAPDRLDLSGIKVNNGEYHKGQLSDKMEHDRVLIGNAVNHYKQKAMGKLGITFAVSCKHSEMIAQAYRDAGVPAMHIDGETPEHERRQIARAFANRELLQLVNAELLCFGFDLSSASGVKGVTIEALSDCQPTKSLAKQCQKWGRVLRKKDYPALIFDHANNMDEKGGGHGLPCDDREWSLEDRAGKAKGSGERAIPTVTCINCFFCHKPAPVCPECGHVHEIKSREIEEVEGELAEIDMEALRQEKKQQRMEVGMARTYEDLRRIAKERGYAPSWVFVQAKAKGIKK